MKKIVLLLLFCFLLIVAILLPYILYGINHLIQKLFDLICITGDLKSNYVEYSVASISTLISSFIAYFAFKIERRMEANIKQSDLMSKKASATIVFNNLKRIIKDVKELHERSHKQSDFKKIKAWYNLSDIEEHIYDISEGFSHEELNALLDFFNQVQSIIAFDEINEDLLANVDDLANEVLKKDSATRELKENNTWETILNKIENMIHN